VITELIFIVLLAAAAPTFEQAYQAGLAALNANKLAEAQFSLEAASKLQPRNPQVWLALAQVFFKQNKNDLANASALKAEAAAGTDVRVLHALAFFYTEMRNPARAASLEARYAERNPQDADAYPRAIELYQRAGQNANAIAVAQKAVLKDSANPALHALLAKCYDESNQFARAVPEFQQTLKLRPYDESSYFEFSQAYLRRQKFAEALAILDEARKRFDKSAQIELARGVALYGLRRFPETVDAFLYTIQLAPEIDQPYLFLGRMLDVVEGKMPEVSGALASYASLKPDNYLTSFLYAKALAAQQADPVQVEPLLRKSIGLNPAYWESHFELGAALEKKMDWVGALAEFKKAVELNPKASTPHYRMARVYDRLGKKEEAGAERALHAKLSAAEKAATERPGAPAGVVK
jgi:tetratricopeptide (TPR) repeat protein